MNPSNGTPDTEILQKYDALCKSSKGNPLLSELLTWVDARASNSLSDYSPARRRAYYLAMVRVLGFLLTNYLDIEHDIAPSEVKRLRRHFDEAERLAGSDKELQFQLTCSNDPTGIIARCWRFDFDNELSNVLRELHSELKVVAGDFQAFEAWRQASGRQKLERFRIALRHRLSYSDAEKEEIKAFYGQHNTLAQALSPDADTSFQLREQMEKKLLSPN